MSKRCIAFMAIFLIFVLSSIELIYSQEQKNEKNIEQFNSKIDIDYASWIPFYGSLIIAAVLIITYRLNKKALENTRQSIDDNRKERDLRQRPWIVSLKDDKGKSIKIVKDHIEFKYVNQGPIPAFNVTTSALSSKKSLSDKKNKINFIRYLF